MYSKPHFLDDLNYKNTRVKESVSNIEDMYDGQAYKDVENHFSTGASNITLTWNSDGVQVYNSTSFSLWPFFLVVNELPPHKRYLSENMLIGGIWCGLS